MFTLDACWANFVLGKPRLCPIKESSMSNPKLKLEAAVTPVSFKKCYERKLWKNSIHKICFWCDSKAALNYIRNEHSNFTCVLFIYSECVYLALRINEFWENSSVSQCQFIPSNMNLADDATRYISFNQFGSNSGWFNGPNFLHNTTLDEFSEKVVSREHIP